MGLSVALENIDKAIEIIKTSKKIPMKQKNKLLDQKGTSKDDFILNFINVENKESLFDDKSFKLSEVQAKSILEIRLSRLTGLERTKLSDDLKECVKLIEDYLNILSSSERLNSEITNELNEIKEKINSPRKTEISESEEIIDDESLITSEDVVVTLTNTGYIKRVPLNSYRSQRRGGKGRAGMTTKEEDFVNEVFVVNTLTPLLFFSSMGIVYKLKTYKLPSGSPTSKGKALLTCFLLGLVRKLQQQCLIIYLMIKIILFLQHPRVILEEIN